MLTAANMGTAYQRRESWATLCRNGSNRGCGIGSYVTDRMGGFLEPEARGRPTVAGLRLAAGGDPHEPARQSSSDLLRSLFDARPPNT